MSTGRYLYLASQSAAILLPTRDNIFEARFFDPTQGKIRNRELLMTRFRFSLRFSSDHPMCQSRGANRQAEALNPRSATSWSPA